MVRPGRVSDQLSSLYMRISAACIVALVMGAAVVGTGLASTHGNPPKGVATTPARGLPPAAATAAFGIDLLRTQPAGNLVVSPDSIATALAMAGTGGAGRTATEMARALHLRGPDRFGAVGALQRTILRTQESVGDGHADAPTLNLANGLFLQQGLPVKAPFLSDLRGHFGAAPELVDFVGDPLGSIGAINAWVSLQTNGVIPALFQSPLGEARLVLTNAVYLDADWRHPFDPEETAPDPFYNRSGRTSAEFMHQTREVRYAAGRGYAAVELPYRASTLSMLIVLPAGKDIGAFQRRLAPGWLTEVTRGLSRHRVDLSLPRFHMKTYMLLNRVLTKLGMTTAFGEAADFSGITGDRSLKIGTVVHAADLMVDEAGTVAAAATGVVMLAKSMPARPVRFNANHPFLFFVRDTRTGAVLFAGRVTNPAATGV